MFLFYFPFDTFSFSHVIVHLTNYLALPIIGQLTWHNIKYEQHCTDLFQNLTKKVTMRFSQRSCRLRAKIVNEYDQEIPQSQTADNPVAP